MKPRTPILRENEMLQSPSPSSAQKSSKHRKRSKENVAPPDLNSMSPATAVAKTKSPLPPRPPTLKRKLSADAIPEHSVPGSLDSGVKVIVRMRPLTRDEEEGEMIVQKLSSDSLSFNGQTFTFDSVADMGATQKDIFQLIGAPLVENCLAGFNSSVFAYGQTGSGKTYTMWGPANALMEENLSNDQQGLTPRVLEQLFSRINEEQTKHADKQLQYQCRCSFLEIYNEQIMDLLDPSQKNLQIREDVRSGVYVENLTEEYICSMKDVSQLLLKGLSNRRTGATSINADSSRSHCVFTCVVESRFKNVADGVNSCRTSRINLVDLAGSERQKLTGAAGDRLKEAGNINRSLSQLGNLINILAEVSQSGKQRHIPYRDSRLTFLLQESLGGNAKLAMICAISPAQRCKSETFSTLRFAQRAKAIKNKAVVNEVMEDDVNVLREMIKQLKDELLRMKANGNNPADPNGGYSPGFIRRSLNLLKYSLNRPPTRPHIDDDSDEEMEIDDDAVEKPSIQTGVQLSGSSDDRCSPISKAERTVQHSEDTYVDMEEEISQHFDKKETIINHPGEAAKSNPDSSISGSINNNNNGIDENKENTAHLTVEALDVDSVRKSSDFTFSTLDDEDFPGQLAEGKKILKSSLYKFVNEEQPSTVGDERTICSVAEVHNGLSTENFVEVSSNISVNDSKQFGCPSSLSVVPSDTSPILESPPPSVSPRVSNSRKSMRTSSTLTASQKGSKDESKLGPEVVHSSFAKTPNNSSSNAFSTQKNKILRATTEHLAASLHRGLEIIDSNRKSSLLMRSLYRSSFKPVGFKLESPVAKVDVGVQTFPQDDETSKQDLIEYLCNNCKRRSQLELKEAIDAANMQLVPVDAECQEKSLKQVPKAVEKVLAGSFRREMALEEFCAKQASEVVQLNRLVQQYKHERECNAIIAQTREDKILRLESLMDGILPTEEFMEEELVSLRDEYKLLKEKYENHPEVLRTKIELQRVQAQLEQHRTFFELGEREVLIEEIQDLRSQLQYYIDSSSMSGMKRSPLLQLTCSPERSSASHLSTIPELTGESAEEKLEQERVRWTEAESKWISLAEELRNELEATRSLAEKRKQELESEKKCAEELKEAMQLAMEGNARMLEHYADLEEKHMQLLLRHRKIQDGIDDVKRAAAKAGVRNPESKFINALAAEISALKAEREKERRYFRDENKGLQMQLRDTAEAVQAAGELLVRLKEAEEAVATAEKRAFEAERETEKAYKEIQEVERKHEKEIIRLNQLLAESKLPKEDAEYDNQWRQEFEPFCNPEEASGSTELGEPSLWFAGYDRCNI